jgi:hypothetical protein
MLSHNYSYENCLRASERVYWKIEDVLVQGSFDMSKPLMPDRLAGVREISCLNKDEQRKLNQIRGYSYAHLFGFVEEFIIAQIVKQAEQSALGDDVQLRSLLRFAEEEVKHQELFRRVKSMFERDFGSECKVVGGERDVARFVLSKSPLAVMLLTTMLEWMTQRHYLEIFQDNAETLDPMFVSVLKHHWIEEAQHAKLDELEIDTMVESLPIEAREKAVDEVLEVGGAFDGLLKAQVGLDIENLEKATGRTFTASEKDQITAHQHRAYRYTFLVSGLDHDKFINVVGQITKDGVGKLKGAATALAS